MPAFAPSTVAPPPAMALRHSGQRPRRRRRRSARLHPDPVGLLLPAVGLLADALHRRGHDVPAPRDSPLQVIPAQELGLRVEVVLREGLRRSRLPLDSHQPPRGCLSQRPLTVRPGKPAPRSGQREPSTDSPRRGGHDLADRVNFFILRWSPVRTRRNQPPTTISHPAYSGHRGKPPE